MVRADLLMYPHLTRLHIRIDYRGGWDMISLLLENCPNLQVLGIEKVSFFFGYMYIYTHIYFY